MGVPNSIDYYDDFCILNVPELFHSDSFEISLSPITQRFDYLEISYPKGKSSKVEPAAFSSYTAHPRAGNDLVILNRNGQDFNSSGGPVIDKSTEQARAMNICIERGSNAVKALDLSLLNSRINEALLRGFVPSLSRYNYFFSYAKDCGPIGGRGGGP